ncbi:hemicentin-1-like [Mytilus edulis]|uniref:hemicentin-1-like n=1 Tax=Mytilus edulis TaxID=6550 RepID=UPI0039EF8701
MVELARKLTKESTCSFILAGICFPLLITVPQSSYNVLIGNSVTLICNVTSDFEWFDVYWEMIPAHSNESSELAIDSEMLSNISKKYSGSNNNTPSLTIFDAETSDGGIYICFAANEYGTWNSSDIHLTVHVPLKVTIPQSSYSVLIGNSVTLICNVTSDFEWFDVYWQRIPEDSNESSVLAIDSETISNISTKYSGSNYNTPSLTIFDAETSNEGIYICFAANEYGTWNSSDIHLTVYVPLKVTIPQSSYSVLIGNSVTLICNVTSNFEWFDVYWEMIPAHSNESSELAIDSEMLSNISTKYSGSNNNTPSLTIFDAETSDGGIYICFAANEYREWNSSDILLTVHVPLNVTVPQSSYSVLIGNSVTLICNVTSDFEWFDVYWEMIPEHSNESSELAIDSEMLSNISTKYSGSNNNTPSLTIFDTETSDGGIYICFAANEYGEWNSSDIHLTVQVRLKVTIPQSSYSVLIGNSVTLICNVTSDIERLDVYWQRITEHSNESLVLAIDSDMLSNISTKYSGSNNNTSSLTIFDAETADGGIYICFAANEYGTWNSSDIHLTIHVPLKVTVPQSSYSVLIGNSVTLICNVTSDFERFDVYWQRIPEHSNESSVLAIDSEMLSNISTKYSGSKNNTPSLTIFDAETSDGGIYICFAANEYGTWISSDIHLTVHVPLKVTVPQSSYSVLIGNSVTLICNVTSDIERFDVYWQRVPEDSNESSVLTIDSEMLSNISTKYSGSNNNTPSLTIFDAETSDEGIYICFAANEYGTWNSSDIHLTVHVPLKVTVPQSSYSVLIGNSVTLICNVTSDFERFGVYWQRIPEHSNESSVLAIDSEMLSNISTKYSGSNNNTQSLTIFDAETSDGGIYVCFAANEYGTWNSSDIHLTVHVPLKVTVPQSSYSVLIGNSVTLICNVTSDFERFDVYWQRIPEHSNESSVLAIDSEILSNISTKYSGSNNNTPSLAIFDAETSDEGIYICFAANEYGTWNSSDIYLTVHVPLKVTVPQSSYSVLIGNSVTLICNVTSDFERFDVYWQRVPEYSNESSVLTIDSEMLSNISTKYSGSNNNTPSLTIFDAETSDGGIYVCFAANEYGTWNSSDIHLTVHVPLKVTVPQSSYSVLIGNSVTLICNVTSVFERFDVYWQRIPEHSNESSVLAIDSEILSNISTKYSGSNNNTPSLTIFDAETSDVGIYICFAANEYGTWNSSDIYLTVHVPLKVTVPQSSYSVLIGNSVTLICNVTSDFERFHVYWQRVPEDSNESSVLTIDSEMLSNISTKYSGSNNNTPSLTIFDAETSDGGIYICFAANEYGTWNSSDIHLTVHVPLKVTVPQSSYSVLIGNSVTLICNVTSDFERFDVYWQRIPEHSNESSVLAIDSEILSNISTKYSGSNNNTPSLAIFDAETSDEGIYICFAANEYGTWNSSDIYLTVHVPLKVTVPQSSYSVLIGNSVTLICNVTSDFERFDVYWQRVPEYSNESSVLTIDSEMLSNISTKYSGSNNNTPSLTIFDAETSDGGIYICFAANEYGTWNSSDIHLTVHVPLKVTVPQSSYSVLIGNSVTLICNVTSVFERFDVYWQRIPEHSNESSVLAIDSEILSNISTKYSGSNNNTPSLTIFDAETSDVGIYICFAANEYGTWNSSDIYLTVHVPLKVTVPQSSYSVLIGNSVTLICNVTSDFERFDVYWQRIPEHSNESSVLAIDSEILSNISTKYSGSNNNTPSLTIFDAETSDGGIYICFAANEYGTWNSSDIHLTVHVPLKVTVPQSSYSVLIGNSVTLICNVTSDFERFDVYWQRIPEHSNESSVLAIDSEILSNISTKYSGSNNNTPSLAIFDAETSDEGIYICFAANEYGTWNSSDIYLTVHVPLKVTVPQSSYSVLIGNSVTLICNVTSDFERFDVYWQRVPEYSNESSVLTIDSEMLSNISTKYSGSNNNTPSLTIFDAETSDGGIYICFAANEYGTWNSSDIHLTVHVPLKVTVPQSSYSVLIGNSVTLICNVTSVFERFDVYWQRIPEHSNESSVLAIDSEILSNISTKYSGSNNNTPSLTIFDAETSDVGIYICFAANEYGTWNSSDIYLTVHVPLKVTVPQSSYSVLIGNSVTLICNVTSDFERFHVYWQRVPEDSNESSVLTIDSEMLSNISTKYSGSNNNTPSLTIFDAETSDGGIYICFAANEYGTWNSSDIHLTVHVPLKVTVPQSSYSVLIGNSVTLICNVTSVFERFDVYWQRIPEHSNESSVLAIDSEILSNISTKYSGSNNNTPFLTIFDAETSDVGIYICFAANEYGTWNSSDIYLTVHVPLKVTVPQSSYSVLIGNSVTLICNVTSDFERFDVYWQRVPEDSNESSVLTIDSEMLSNISTKYSGSNNNTSSLTIFDAETSDGGIYICFAANEYGTWNSSDIHLTVHVPLKVTVPQSSYSVLIGNSVTLICKVTSVFERFDVYWQRIPEHSNESSVLAIDSEILSNISTKYSGSNNNTPSLTIFDAETSDGGIYICFAANEYGTWNSSDIYLTVHVPLKVTVPQSSYSVFIGNSVTLICNVTSDFERFGVYWQRIPEHSNESSVLAIDSEMLSNISTKYSGSNNNTPSLTIFDAETSDGGIYVCFAANEYGTWNSSDIHLTVHVPLKVTVPQSSYSVLIGNSVTLICNVTSDFERFDVYWQRIPEDSNESSVLAIDSEMLSNINTKYSGSNNNTPSLTIFDAETSDGGIYICFAANEYGTWNSSDIHLTVHVPLKVTVPQSSYSVLIGNSVALICNVTSDFERFDVYWQRIPEDSNESSVLAIDSEMLSNISTKYSGSNNNTPSLTIFDAETSDGGIYICFATNEYGTWNSSDIHLTVHVPLKVTVPQSSYSVLIGNSVTLICNVTSDFERFDVYWQRIPEDSNESSVLAIDSEMLSNISTKYSGSNNNTPSLTIFDAETSDGGIYICFAANEYGTWNSSDIHLTVHVPLKVTVPQSSYSVLIGNSVALICNVTSVFERFDVYWQRIPEHSNESSVLAIDSEMLSNISTKYSGSNNNTPSLTIFDAETSDGGIYVCFAANEYGTWNSSDIHLTVHVPLKVTVPQSSYSVLIGNSVTLICNVTSDFERFDVYWQRIPEDSNESSVLAIDSEMLSNISTKYSGSNNNTPSLTIFDAETSDGGIYICFAANEYGTWNSSDIHLTVHVPLKVTVPQSSYSVLIGNSVTLICNVTSDFERFDVYWQRISEHSNESSVLAIDSEMLSNISTKYSGSNNNTPSLTIFDAETSDGGIYICFAANEYGTWNSSDIHLTVHVPLKVTVPQSSYSVFIGNSVTLICNVTSVFERFDVYWQRIPEHSTESSELAIDSEMLSNISTKYSGSNDNTPSLTIFDAETSDGGIYICFAANEYGTWNSSDIHLTVHVPLKVTVPQSSYSVLIGNSVTLICNVTSDFERFDVYWQRIPEHSNESSVLAIDSEMLSNISTKYSGSNNNTPSLTIFNAETSDGGIYICFAANEYGTWNSSDIYLTVHGMLMESITRFYYIKNGVCGTWNNSDIHLTNHEKLIKKVIFLND